MYRTNSYPDRVLLTRGRDGLIAFIPPEGQLDPIPELLVVSFFKSIWKQ
jgi:hypothetical protein